MPITSVALQPIDHVSFCLLSRGCLLEKMNGEESSWPSWEVEQDSQRTKAKTEESRIDFSSTTFSTSSFSATHRKLPQKPLQTVKISVSAFGVFI